jgi:hypothetical protein
MGFTADELRKIAESRRPAAEAEEKRRRQEEATEALRKEAELRATLARIETDTITKRLEEVKHKIEAAAQSGKRTCQYDLGEFGRTRCHGYNRFPAGYKRTLSRRNLWSEDQGLYDDLRSRGFSVEIVNVNAQYPNSYWYAMIISW